MMDKSCKTCRHWDNEYGHDCDLHYVDMGVCNAVLDSDDCLTETNDDKYQPWPYDDMTCEKIKPEFNHVTAMINLQGYHPLQTTHNHYCSMYDKA